MPDTLYVVGDAPPQRADHARVYTKPPTYSGGRWNTGSGYETIRSYEFREHTARRSKEDVYAYVHRLCAVAWKLPDDQRNDYLRLLDGVDVHHESGVEWDNREATLELLEHGRHSEVTNAELRAYGADAKRTATGERSDDGDACVRCGDVPETACESPDWDGVACLECAPTLSDGAAIEVV